MAGQRQRIAFRKFAQCQSPSSLWRTVDRRRRGGGRSRSGDRLNGRTRKPRLSGRVQAGFSEVSCAGSGAVPRTQQEVARASRRVTERARLEALLLELKIRAQHIADQYAMLHDAVAEFNERVEIECVATKSWTPPR